MVKALTHNIYNLFLFISKMPTQDTSNIKEKIMLAFKRRGPSLPVHIASETGLSMLFASAFLSELLSEKKIKLSFMKVGSSPIYLISGQEPMLERFSQHLKSKEKEAFELLKKKKFLKDEEQVPAIRIALREIKDFAIAFKKDEEIFWRYFTIPKNEFEFPKIKPMEKVPQQEDKKKPEEEISLPKEEKSKEKTLEKQELNIFDKQKTAKTSAKKRTITKKNNDKFFNKVKEFLFKRSIEILDIENFGKNDLVLRVKTKEEEKLLVAYNKKRICEADIIKAHKKATEFNLKYIVLSLGEPLKKIDSLIKAVKNLSEIEKIE